MRAHKIVESKSVLTLKQLQSLEMSKEECFENVIGGSFDYALPQQWLNEFADWCKANSQKLHKDKSGCSRVTYDVIASTTVWHYPPYTEGNSGPLTCCAEVYYAYLRYDRQTVRGAV